MKYNKLKDEDTIREIMFAFSTGASVREVCDLYGIRQGKAYELRKISNMMDNMLATRGTVLDPMDNWLVMSDLHFPFHHPDTFDFLYALKCKYKPTKVINTGDEVDNHYLNFHTKEGRILNPTGERSQAIECIARLQDMFPEMYIVHSNHGDLVGRKAAMAGLHPDDVKSRAERLEVTADWTWQDNLQLTMPNGHDVYFRHDYSSNVLSASQKLGMSLVQGHFHTRYTLDYWSTPNSLNFALQMPCLIDAHSPAFKYISRFKGRILVGAAIIEKGLPKLIPMVKGRDGRWTGEIN